MKASQTHHKFKEINSWTSLPLKIFISDVDIWNWKLQIPNYCVDQRPQPGLILEKGKKENWLQWWYLMDSILWNRHSIQELRFTFVSHPWQCHKPNQGGCLKIFKDKKTKTEHSKQPLKILYGKTQSNLTYMSATHNKQQEYLNIDVKSQFI